jgi:hypothetical protein
MTEYDFMKRSIERLGIRPEDYRVLKLLPLIYVAWADGKMDQVKRERIHTFAATHFELSSKASAVLQHWLEVRPTPEYIREGLHDLFLLATAKDDIEVDFSELPGLLFYCETLGAEAGSRLGIKPHPSESAEKALREIAAELHIDHGESWAKLLDELAT